MPIIIIIYDDVIVLCLYFYISLALCLFVVFVRVCAGRFADAGGVQVRESRCVVCSSSAMRGRQETRGSQEER